ncbi:MAG: protein kinase [Planctomycetaceae bacterium]|jgi:serine/threonine-protein kinase|nr:protein kinase [Planctomycetaceae bacterium]
MKILANEYQLLSQIYDGLSGCLWLAQELSKQRKVWIRLLPKQIHNDITSIERIKSQFNKLQSVIHELNISNVIFPDKFFETSSLGPFLVSHFVEGESVDSYADKWINAEGHFPLSLIPKLFEPVAEILDKLQQKNFIHRSLSPESIIINQTEGVNIFDFELTGIIREQTVKAEPTLLLMDISTIRYMSPEILRGQPATQFSDQYSLAMIIYEIAAGYILFDSKKINVLLKQITDYIPPDIPNCSAEINLILKKALNKDPSLRFTSTKQFIGKLIQSCESENLDNSTYQLKEIQKINEPKIIQLPKILDKFEPAISFRKVKNATKSQFKTKNIKSKVIKRILSERRSQKSFVLCYLAIFISCIIVTIIFREQIAVIIKDIFNL